MTKKNNKNCINRHTIADQVQNFALEAAIASFALVKHDWFYPTLVMSMVCIQT